VDLVWTQAVPGGYAVRFSSQPGGAAPATPDTFPWIDVAFGAVLVAVLVVGVIVRRHVRR